jgi:colanic acid biosynthesis glycosyl transferase WcaI
MTMNEERNGVRIARSYVYVPNPATPFKRIVHEASFILSSAFRLLTCKRPDVLLVISPPLGLAVSAILFNRIWRIPYVLDVQDLQPDSAADFGMLPAWAIRLLYKVEAAAYRHARLVTTLTESMRKRIVGKGVAEEKVELLEPRMDDSLTDLRPEEGSAFRKRYGLKNEFLVAHSGNMGVKQGLDVVLDTAALSRSDSSMLFLLVGDGVDRPRIQRRAAEMDLRNVRFLPLLSQEDFRGLLAASDVCLITQQQSVSEVAFPSKVVTYLAAGRPTVASVNPEYEIARTIRESGAGSFARAEDPDALLAAIRQVRGEDPAKLSENARAYASQRWSSARVLKNLEQSLVAAAGPAVRSLA